MANSSVLSRGKPLCCTKSSLRQLNSSAASERGLGCQFVGKRAGSLARGRQQWGQGQRGQVQVVVSARSIKDSTEG
jgi:hypothetical protein